MRCRTVVMVTKIKNENITILGYFKNKFKKLANVSTGQKCNAKYIN